MPLVHLLAALLLCLVANSPAGGQVLPLIEQARNSAELEQVLRERSLDPESPQALERLSELLGKAQDEDGEVAYLLYAIDAYDKADGLAQSDKQAKIRSLERRLERVGAGLSKVRSSRNAYLKELTWVLRLYANNQKKLRSALEVGGRVLAFRPDHPVARRIVEEVMGQGDDSRADWHGGLRAEGLRLLGQKELTRSRTFLTQWAKDHRLWRQAGVIRSEHYIVKSNIGYDVASKAAHSLDRIADYYAEFFEVEPESVTERTPVFLFRTRDEFIRVSDTPIANHPGVLAFIWSGYEDSTLEGEPELRSQIFGYDPRDQGRSLESLWPTLWHEASHQYMSRVTEGRPSPPWIAEGMSSYFEGARFSRQGEILVGLPARMRLENLTGLLRGGSHPLEQMLAAEGNLSGLHYAVYWGVVYYLRHGRDGAGKLLRPEALPRVLQLLRERDLGGDELFRLGVLNRKGETLEEFQADWEAWALTLLDLESSARERSESFAALAHRQLESGNAALAHDLFREALLRAPNCLSALQGMADLRLDAWEATNKKDRDLADETLYWGNRWYTAAFEAQDDSMLERATLVSSAVDKAGFTKIKNAEAKYRKSIESMIERTVENARPKTAVAIARLFLDDILGGNRRDALAKELRIAGKLTLGRTFLAFDGKTMGGLSAGAQQFNVKSGWVEGESKRPKESLLFIDRELSPLFHLQGEFRLGDSNTMLGFCYSSEQANQLEGFLLRLADGALTAKLEQGYRPFDLLPKSRVGHLAEAFQAERMSTSYVLEEATFALDPKWKAGDWLSFRLSRTTPGWLALVVEGEVVATRAVDPAGSEVSLGLLLWGGQLNLRKLEVVELDRL